jgi:hypothetical protein
MKNLMIRDTLDGGTLVFVRKNYVVDEGIYTELYCALFATKAATWLGDNAFNVNDYKVASRTENAMSVYGSNIESNISLIKSAVKEDCDRFMKKNTSVIVKSIEIEAYKGTILKIRIGIDGTSTPYEFIVAKTQESLSILKTLEPKENDGLTDWLLARGYWNDEGIWRDDAFWIDNV